MASWWGRTTGRAVGHGVSPGGPVRATRASSTEALLEGSCCFWCDRADPRRCAQRPGFILGAFAFGYGVARSICEFFREPDAQIGSCGMVDHGTLLSLPLLLSASP